MKTIYTLTACLLFTIQAYSQVGINTEKPKAVLHVKTATDSIPLKIETSTGNPVMMIDKKGNIGIGTESPTRSVHVKAEEIRVEGTKDMAYDQTYDAIIVSDDKGNVDKVPLGAFITDMPTLKNIKYVSHSFIWNTSMSVSDIEKASTVEMDGIRLRFSPYTNITQYGVGYIQMQLVENNFYGVFWEKNGSGFSQDEGGGLSGYSGPFSRYFNGVSKGFSAKDDINGWINFQIHDYYINNSVQNPAYKADNYNPQNGDIVTALLVLNNTKEFYRLNFVAYYDAAIGSGQMSIFIERLTD